MKIVIVALIAFLLGFGAFWGYNNYNQVLKENEELKKTNQKIPTTVNGDTVYPTDIPTPTINEEFGSIEGVLGYPAGSIPPLEVYVYNSDDPKKFYKTETNTNQTTFKIQDIIPGLYYAVAYVKEGNNDFAGGYTNMVPCGLSVECTDHSLIKVKVNAGATTTGVEIRDWYAPDDFFPKKP